MSQPTLEQVHMAKLLRRDVEPNEPKVRARVRTCATGFIWEGVLIDCSDAELEEDDKIPMRFGWVTIEVYQSQLAKMRAELAQKGATAEQIRRACDDLRSDLLQLNAVGEDASPRELLEALTGGVLKGELSGKHRRPAFTASFGEMNRDKRGLAMEFFPIIAIETEADYLAAKALEAETAPTSKKR